MSFHLMIDQADKRGRAVLPSKVLAFEARPVRHDRYVTWTLHERRLRVVLVAPGAAVLARGIEGHPEATTRSQPFVVGPASIAAIEDGFRWLGSR